MILKTVDYNTSRWVMYESDKVELGKMWLGVFGEIGDPNTQLALYEWEQDEPQSNDPNAPPKAKRVPILLGVDIGGPDNKHDLLVDPLYAGEIFESHGALRKPIHVAVLHKANGAEQLVAFVSPAYVMNDAGKTVEKI